MHGILRRSIVPLVVPALLLTSAASHARQACSDDLNGDGVVDGADLAQLLSSWGATYPASIDAVTPASGPLEGGTPVTIVGAHLAATTLVEFGGVAASDLTVVSSTEVHAITPPGSSGPVDIAVTTPAGTTTLAGGFTYEGEAVLPAPDSIAPAGVLTDSTPTYRWSVVAEATWYQLWVNDPTGNVILAWYTASEVNASSGECAVTPDTALAVGDGTWWVRAWNSEQGNGPWSQGLDFTLSDGGVGWATVLEFEPDPAVVTDPKLYAGILATGLPWRVRDDASQIEMLLVPPGTFMMGCSSSNQFGCYADEFPVHEVTLAQPFYLGRHEVTQAQWADVMGGNPSFFQSPSDEVPESEVPMRPVERVSWNSIQEFEAATGLRLPTEAEWEYACRAGTGTAFNLPPNGTGDDGLLGGLAWFQSDSGAQTRPVGGKLANNLGLHDMHGNVYEWCEDWFAVDYYGESPSIDPPGPSNGAYRVLRGGYWGGESFRCRSSYRDGGVPALVNVSVGFRPARTP